MSGRRIPADHSDSQSDFPGDFFSPPPTYRAEAIRSRLALKITKGERFEEQRREMYRFAYGDDPDA